MDTYTNSAEVIAFATHVRGLTDQQCHADANRRPRLPKPRHSPTIPAMPKRGKWERPLRHITVPAANGDTNADLRRRGQSCPPASPLTPSTRVISGTPTATGNGTITIRASNSAGDADWTITYATTAPASAPSRPDAPDVDRRQR